jgi:hypothetical protein
LSRAPGEKVDLSNIIKRSQFDDKFRRAKIQTGEKHWQVIKTLARKINEVNNFCK